MFSRNIQTWILSIEDKDKEQSKLLKELSDTNKRWKANLEKPFLQNVRFLLSARGKVVSSFKSYIFPLKNLTPETTPEPTV